MIKLTCVLLAVFTLSLMGCNGSEFPLASVSGTVKFDGEPVGGVRVVFQPRAVDGNAIAGPWSSGLTNLEGEYSLVTRYDQRGAMVAAHDVSFAFDGQEDIDELRDQLSEAKGDKEEFEKIKKRIEAAKAMAKSRQLIPLGLRREFTVPSNGSDAADFELSKEETAATPQ